MRPCWPVSPNGYAPMKGTNRFGVKLIRNPLAVSEDELLLETCDSAIRTLYCDIGSRDAPPPI
jgi:hypothetical protein